MHLRCTVGCQWYFVLFSKSKLSFFCISLSNLIKKTIIKNYAFLLTKISAFGLFYGK